MINGHRMRDDMERCARLASAYDPFPHEPNPPEPPKRMHLEHWLAAVFWMLAALTIGALIAVAT